MNHSIIDSPAFDIAYDRYLRNKLSNYARERTPSIDYFELLSGGWFEIKRYVSNSLQTKGKSKKGGKGKEMVSDRPGKAIDTFSPLVQIAISEASAPNTDSPEKAAIEKPARPMKRFKRLRDGKQHIVIDFPNVEENLPNYTPSGDRTQLDSFDTMEGGRSNGHRSGGYR